MSTKPLYPKRLASRIPTSLPYGGVKVQFLEFGEKSEETREERRRM